MTSEQNEMHSRETPIHEFLFRSDGEESHSGWGLRDFLKKNTLFNNAKLLPNDKLTIFCQITYSQMIFTSTSHQSNSITFQPSVPNNRLSEELGSLLKNGKFSDVTILVNGTEYPVHKTLLVARSAVFTAMFDQKAADKYDLGELKALCENVLSNNLSADSAAKTLALADLHHASELKSKTMNYIVTNASKVMSTEGWKTIASNLQLINEVCQVLSQK
ncbi:hypothetical protein U1Q18_046963 [Sarracenia purpurea var. burkii]